MHGIRTRGLSEQSPNSPAADCTPTLLCPPCGCHRETRTQTRRPFLDTGLHQAGNPASLSKPTREGDSRFQGFLGLGLQCSEVKQHPFQVSTGPRTTATWRQLCGSCQCTNTHMHDHYPVLSAWARSLPPGPKNDKSTHMVDKNTQSHSRPQTHTPLHTRPRPFSDTQMHMVQTD